MPNGHELAWLTKKVAANDFLDSVPNPARRADDGGASSAHQACHLHHQGESNLRSGARRSRSGQRRPQPSRVRKALSHLTSIGWRSQFVDLDNILCSGEVSGNGWPWSTAARETDFNVKTVPLSYAGRGAPSGDTAADGPEGQKSSKAISGTRRCATISPSGIMDSRRGHRRGRPVVPDPFASHTVVEIPVWPHLVGVTDPYFRAFDNTYPDFRRERRVGAGIRSVCRQWQLARSGIRPLHARPRGQFLDRHRWHQHSGESRPPTTTTPSES